MINPSYPHNPLLPAGIFVPDVEARQWSDGNMYLYGSWDIGFKAEYCSSIYHVFSSPDLINWTDNGVSFRSAGAESDVSWSSAALYAPDAICKDGKYYLYFCLSDQTQGVATSHCATGPFKNAVQIHGITGIDPGVFIDDDGQGYLYWGQFDEVRVAKLRPDMLGIEEGSITQPLSVAQHNFHEGSSMRKRNGIYYYIYADTGRHDGRPTCLGYATSASPTGPFTYQGVIIDNFGCDSAVWNNHGSIAQFNDRWFVFYHRSSKGSIYSRRVCAEPISFNEDGTIPEVEMTSQGIGGPIDARRHLDAGIACLLSGSIRIDSCPLGGEQLTQIFNGDWAAYKYLDYGEGVSGFTAVVSSTASGSSIELHLDSPEGMLIGTCMVPDTHDEGKYITVSCPVSNAKGIHALYLKFNVKSGNATIQVARFGFV
jgi:arabinoxylan arabinofuranohydrolase